MKNLYDYSNTEIEPIEYIIYCRKSTDESSNKQVASIPRQIAECLRFAEREGLKIANKPNNFSDFENERDLFKEDNSTNRDDAKLYQATRGLFIIKEQDSAKTPFNRKKWRKLTKLIEKGKVQGLLSYSPDRQSRNMLEGGQLIDFVDQDLLDLKYANFHFEPNASGKMMLGIWFVFSKQYSDKLSEDVSSANKSKRSRGETIGQQKFGYRRGDDNKWKADGKNFELIKSAFQIKIDKRWSDSRISEYLNTAGFKYFRGKKYLQMTHQKLSRMWTDPFYYGVWIQANTQVPVDLRVVDELFEPMISEDVHLTLLQMSQKPISERRKRGTQRIDKLASFRVIKQGVMVDKNGNSFATTLPNLNKRFASKLSALRELNPKASYGDIVKPHQIKMRCAKSRKSISFDKVDALIKKELQKIVVSERHAKLYLHYAKRKLIEMMEENDIKRREYQCASNSFSGKRQQFLEQNFSKVKDKEEQKFYDEKMKNFAEQIKFYDNLIKKLNKDESIHIEDVETVIKTLKNIGRYYEKATYVQKAKFLEMFVLNIVFYHENWLEIKFKPEVRSLFCLNGGKGEN